MPAAYPKPYTHRTSPTLSDLDGTYVLQELSDIQETLTGVLDMLPSEATKAPAHPRPGMIRRAVAPWRPVAGQSGDRWVSWDAASSSWVYLAP